MKTKQWVVRRWHVAVFGMLLPLALGAPACGGQTLENSTETGNPPLLASDRIDVQDASAGQVEVRGAAGAVEPGGASVVVTNTTSGEAASTESKSNGAFRVTLPGSAADEYRVEVSVDGETVSTAISGTEVTSEPTTESTACEKICAGPAECGARETLFPVTGCDCDDSVCECSQAECVEACKSDFARFQEQSAACAASISAVHTCIQSATCEQFRDGDEEALFALPVCQRARTFGDVCDPSFGQCMPAGSVASSSFEPGGPEVIEDCDIVIGCGGINYGLACERTEDGRYDCTCRTNGLNRGMFSMADGCGYSRAPDDDVQMRHVAFACGVDLPSLTDQTEACAPPDYVAGKDGSPGACTIGSRCANGEFEVDCVGAQEGVLCTCLRDGEAVSETRLGPDGCAEAYHLRDPDGPDDRELIAVMNAICRF